MDGLEQAHDEDTIETQNRDDESNRAQVNFRHADYICIGAARTCPMARDARAPNPLEPKWISRQSL
ncbi:hypothetical protein MES5069_1610012 [Mesorhizobium escarrei]|uniref:Uncharacterized protein n=1 Tax=Mesorhizobium escarrei TaxID=666018 RepID=A0ABM9DKG9_9HYPH|nr:hypothetical protein MES5069_1610012 [Mesorhizobium escarrei]